MNDWVLVSERLPNDYDDVIVTIKSDESYGKGTDIKYYTDMATFHEENGYIKCEYGGFFDTCNDWDEGQPLEIIAWMYLPEPYKEE